MPRVIIFSNGEYPDLEAARAVLLPDDYLIAADGGARRLIQMGILPHLVIGDLDSLDEETLLQLTSAEVEIVQFPEHKDETDLELAINRATGMRPDSILIVGALGGRLDQTLANLSLLTDPRLNDLDIRLDDGVEEVFFIRASSKQEDRVEILGSGGDTVSLIPWGAPVEGVESQGLQWSLQGETLYPDSSRGISNVLLDEKAVIKIANGLLLVIHIRS